MEPNTFPPKRDCPQIPIYSPDLFERTKYCSFNARRSRHPGLNAYIGSSVGGLKVRPVRYLMRSGDSCDT